MTDDQQQPADVAPRLSPEREAHATRAENAQLRDSLDFELGEGQKARALVLRLTEMVSALRSDLARARAEAAVLRDAVQVELHIDEQEIRSRCSGMPKRKADWYVRESIRGKRLRKTLAAPQSEEQPAAPVDRSAEAELLALGHQPCCRLLGWLSYMGAYVGGHHPHCKTPTTPPDHQAGDEP